MICKGCHVDKPDDAFPENEPAEEQCFDSRYGEAGYMAEISVKLIDHMGSDLSVCNAARVSFDKESNWEVACTADCRQHGWMPDAGCSTCEIIGLSERDTKLIKYLADHNHWSPFAHAQASFRVSAPIFVARQLQKHTVGLAWNEVSRRYVDAEPTFYTPETWRKRAENVKQGSSDVQMDINRAFKREDGSKNSRRNPCTAKYSNWKARALRDGTPFTVTPDDIPWVTHCPILGIELDWSLGHGEGIKKNSPSLDKITPELGYIPGNVHVISSLANTMKSHATPEEIIAFSKSMMLRYGGVFVDQAPSVDKFYEEMKDLYRRLIAEGMCAEQARMFMPQSMMTEWIWSGSLYAFARVCNLRLDSHAQRETQIVAKGISDHMTKLFPVSWSVLVDTKEH